MNHKNIKKRCFEIRFRLKTKKRIFSKIPMFFEKIRLRGIRKSRSQVSMVYPLGYKKFPFRYKLNCQWRIRKSSSRDSRKF